MNKKILLNYTEKLNNLILQKQRCRSNPRNYRSRFKKMVKYNSSIKEYLLLEI